MSRKCFRAAITLFSRPGRLTSYRKSSFLSTRLDKWTHDLLSEVNPDVRLSKIVENVFEHRVFSRDDVRRLHETLVRSSCGIRLAMQLREDALKFLKDDSKKQQNADMILSWRLFDASLKDWLNTVFCSESLQLKRITFEASSGDVLEKIARGEAVHSVRSLFELKRRLHNGRRCYGFFHHSLPAGETAVSSSVQFLHLICPFNTH